MDGRSFDDSGLGDRYRHASEPAETEDPLPLRRPGYDYVVDASEDGPPALPSRPLETDISQYRAMVDDSGDDPARYPSEPYVGSPRAVRPYVTGAQPSDDSAPPSTDGNGYGSARSSDFGYSDVGHSDPAPSDPGYSGNGYGGNGYGGNGYGGNGYGGSGSSDLGNGGNGYGGADSDAPTYRGRARLEALVQPYVAGNDATDGVGNASPSDSDPALGSGYGAVDLDEMPAAHRSTRPGYSLSEDLAEQRRQDARRVEEAEDEERKQMPMWQEMPLLLVVAFCVAVLIRSFLMQAFFIPSSSMEETLLVGDRVLVNKILYDVRPPARGEVVVFRGTDRWAPENFGEEPGGVLDRIGDTLGDLVGVSRPGEKDFIKRVIGLPGDRVECCDVPGRVMVNGVGIDEPYINVNSSVDIPPTANVCGSRRFTEVVVPEGHLFVMGDNRAVSQDSRCQGTVPIENVIGRAFLIVWPSDRWDTLSVPDTFDSVPAPTAVGPFAPVRPDPVGAVVALPILASLVGSSGLSLKRRSRPRRLPR